MSLTVAHAEKFFFELGSMPKKVRNALQKWQQRIKNNEIDPQKQSPPTVKRLTEYRNLWRLRISANYRLTPISKRLKKRIEGFYEK